MDPNTPQQVLPNYTSNDANIPSSAPGPDFQPQPQQPYPNQPYPAQPPMGPVPEPQIPDPSEPEPTGTTLDPKAKVFDTKKIVGIVIAAIVGIILLAVIIVVIINLVSNSKDTPTNPNDPGQGQVSGDAPEKISFQLPIDKWVLSQPNKDNSAIIMYDIDNNEIVARHNEDQTMRMEFLYTFFVAYEGYYRRDNGTLNDQDILVPGVVDYEGKAYTVEHCLDHMIRFSFLACAETLAGQIGWGNLQASFNDQGFEHTNIHGLTTTPSDLLKLLQTYWKHSQLKESSWETIKDAMLNQTAVTDNPYFKANWRRGLPMGFDTAKVYNKTGFLSTDGVKYISYNDAAFIVFPEKVNKDGVTIPERHYMLVVMTKDTDVKEISKLGRAVEETVKSVDNYE